MMRSPSDARPSPTKVVGGQSPSQRDNMVAELEDDDLNEKFEIKQKAEMALLRISKLLGGGVDV